MYRVLSTGYVCVYSALLRTADPYRVLAPWAQSTKITIRVRI